MCQEQGIDLHSAKAHHDTLFPKDTSRGKTHAFATVLGKQQDSENRALFETAMTAHETAQNYQRQREQIAEQFDDVHTGSLARRLFGSSSEGSGSEKDIGGELPPRTWDTPVKHMGGALPPIEQQVQRSMDVVQGRPATQQEMIAQQSLGSQVHGSIRTQGLLLRSPNVPPNIEAMLQYNQPQQPQQPHQAPIHQHQSAQAVLSQVYQNAILNVPQRVPVSGSPVPSGWLEQELEQVIEQSQPQETPSSAEREPEQTPSTTERAKKVLERGYDGEKLNSIVVSELKDIAKLIDRDAYYKDKVYNMSKPDIIEWLGFMEFATPSRKGGGKGKARAKSTAPKTRRSGDMSLWIFCYSFLIFSVLFS